MRERRYLTFDMENPCHRETFVLFSAQSGRLRSEYVIDCILKTQREDNMEETIRRVITETLKSITLSAPAVQNAAVDLRTTEDISELPDALLSLMDEM
jgi:hypothetical protein